MLSGRLSYLAVFPLTVICTLSVAPAVARAGFEIISHDVFADAASRRTTFTLTFTESPQFFEVDQLGQPAHAFQYFYDARPTGGEVDFAGEDVVIIRGPEIRFAGTIPIRESLNPSGGEFPNAEGWGPTIGEVDFDLDGATLSFTTGWDLLGETDDSFGYHLFALERGALTSNFTHLSRILVSLPSPLIAGGALMTLAACASIVRRAHGGHVAGIKNDSLHNRGVEKCQRAVI